MKMTSAQVVEQFKALRINEIHGTITISPELRDAAVRVLSAVPVVEPVAVPVVAAVKEPAPAPRTPVRKVAKKK